MAENYKWAWHLNLFSRTRVDGLFVRGDFVCVEVLRASPIKGVMSSAVSLPNHTFTEQS